MRTGSERQWKIQLRYWRSSGDDRQQIHSLAIDRIIGIALDILERYAASDGGSSYIACKPTDSYRRQRHQMPKNVMPTCWHQSLTIVLGFSSPVKHALAAQSVARFEHRPAIVQFREHLLGSAMWSLISVFSYTTLQKQLYEKYKVVMVSRLC